MGIDIFGAEDITEMLRRHQTAQTRINTGFLGCSQTNLSLKKGPKWAFFFSAFLKIVNNGYLYPTF